MKTTLVSTLAVSSVLRQSVQRSQFDLISAQKELANGRLADVGRSLGHRVGQAVSLRQEHAHLEAVMASNAAATARLDASQLMLGNIRETAEAFLTPLISAGSSKAGMQTLREQATQGLKALVGSLNASSTNGHLFGGINTDAPPMIDYFATPAASNKQAVDAAFAGAFGMAQSDPGVETISPADMQTFLEGSFRALFDDPQWSTNWSNASSQPIQSRITPQEVVETSVSANEQAMRKLTMAYTMVADLGGERLGESAFLVVSEAATKLVAEAVGEIAGLQGGLGVVQERIATTNERMTMQIDILTNSIAGLENVDPYKAATRVTALMTQLETGYALSARIQRLSILNYL
jgi:flagellar hook-associated protein 3 FlgL